MRVQGSVLLSVERKRGREEEEEEYEEEGRQQEGEVWTIGRTNCLRVTEGKGGVGGNINNTCTLSRISICCP